jgi:hypothetical protein
MCELKDDILLTSDVSIDDEIINVSPGHGFTAAPGEILAIWENNRMMQFSVVSVSTNAVTVSSPSPNAFTVTDAIIVRGNRNVNVDGSITPVQFILKLRNFTIPIDISAIVATMQHGSNVPDDGKFGGLSALTKGLWFRKDNFLKFNLGNYKTNQDFKDVGGVVEYTNKAPAGTNATNIVFDLKKSFGQVMRLSPRNNDTFYGNVRDDISSSAGMDLMLISLLGSYTEGE